MFTAMGKQPDRQRKLLFSWRFWLAIFVTGIVLTELTLRLLLAFPLFGADNEVGYYPLPHQHGSYLLWNDWAFNSRGMGVAEDFSPGNAVDALLVGDSIVYGGNPFPQNEKLGPALARQTGWKVWPVGAGSWALQNELAYLKRIPAAVRDADLIVFVFNSEDFGRPSSWSSEITHPRKHPTSYLAYLFGKLTGSAAPPTPENLAVAPARDLPGAWRSFVQTSGAPVLVIAYPKRTEIGDDCAWVPAWLRDNSARIECYRPPAADAAQLYRDPIHPTARGNELLARFITKKVDALLVRP